MSSKVRHAKVNDTCIHNNQNSMQGNLIYGRTKILLSHELVIKTNAIHINSTINQKFIDLQNLISRLMN